MVEVPAQIKPPELQKEVEVAADLPDSLLVSSQQLFFQILSTYKLVKVAPVDQVVHQIRMDLLVHSHTYLYHRPHQSHKTYFYKVALLLQVVEVPQVSVVPQALYGQLLQQTY